MKKALVLLLALAFVGVTFAQEAEPALTFSVLLDTGIAYKQIGSADGTIALNSEDAGNTNHFDLSGTYTNGDFGAKFTLRTTGFNGTNTAETYVRYAYAWANLFDGMAKVNTGMLNDSTWRAFVKTYGRIRATGVQFQVKPMSGLNLGFFLPATGTATVATKVLADTQFGAAYDMDGFGGFRLGFDMSSVAANQLAYVAIQYSAIENLLITAEYKAAVLDGFADTGINYINEEVDYTMDNLNVGIDFNQYIQMASGSDMGLGFAPYVSYTMDNVKLGLGGDVYYSTAGDIGYDVNPYVTYTVADGADISFGVKYAGGDLADYELTVLADTELKVYMDFIWSF